MMSLPHRLKALLFLAGATLLASPAGAADIAYPDRPVTLVMPFAAGGMGDVLARVLAEHLAKEWKQPVVVDNRAGAGGMIGNQFVARSAPDGYTLLLGISQLVQAPALYPKLQYDIQSDPQAAVRHPVRPGVLEADGGRPQHQARTVSG